MVIAKLVARWKFHIDRARAYVGLIQFVMVSVVFFRSLGVNSLWVSAAAAILAPVGLLVVGWIDARSGVRTEELRKLSEYNPVLMDIHRAVTNEHK